MDHRLNIAHAIIGIILPEIAEGFLKLRLDIGIEFNTRCEAPEDVRRNRQIPRRRQQVALLPNTGIHTKYLWNDDNGGARLARWRRNIDGK